MLTVFGNHQLYAPTDTAIVRCELELLENYLVTVFLQLSGTIWLLRQKKICLFGLTLKLQSEPITPAVWYTWSRTYP
jgi:hypothetical protein